jgi:cytochrome c peroxidase
MFAECEFHAGAFRPDRVTVADTAHRPRLCRSSVCLRAETFVCLLVAAAQLIGCAAASPVPNLRLSRDCPPSFELVGGDTCKFRSLYDMYNSSPASGGLRVKLPNLRDGFSPEQIDLGRYLFFDPLLSGSHRISCAWCHSPKSGFADGRPRSVVPRGKATGTSGTVLLRNAPTLWNVGFLSNLFWDGRAHSLEEQAEEPLFSKNEMATSKQQLERDLNEQSLYRQLFAQAFHLNSADRITADLVIGALAAFEATLISVNSSYDRYAHGDDDALTDQQKRGYAIFRGESLGCTECHTPPLFTNDEIEVTGVPNAPTQPFDAGAEAVTKEPLLRGGFRTPTLRNIARTPPYMHAGQLATLSDAVRFYNDRAGHAVPTNEHLTIDWRMILREPVLSESDIADVVSFLQALTDESMMPAIPDRVPSGLHVTGEVAQIRVHH